MSEDKGQREPPSSRASERTPGKRRCLTERWRSSRRGSSSSPTRALTA